MVIKEALRSTDSQSNEMGAFPQKSPQLKNLIVFDEIKKLAQKENITPREYIQNLMNNPIRKTPEINPEDNYVILSKDEDIIFVSASFKNPTEAIHVAAEKNYNMHQIWKDGKFTPGSAQDIAEDKPPRYYAFDLDGDELYEKQSSTLNISPKNEPQLDSYKQYLADLPKEWAKQEIKARENNLVYIARVVRRKHAKKEWKRRLKDLIK